MKLVWLFFTIFLFEFSDASYARYSIMNMSTYETCRVQVVEYSNGEKKVYVPRLCVDYPQARSVFSVQSNLPLCEVVDKGSENLWELDCPKRTLEKLEAIEGDFNMGASDLKFGMNLRVYNATGQVCILEVYSENRVLLQIENNGKCKVHLGSLVIFHGVGIAVVSKVHLNRSEYIWYELEDIQ